jgi:hypothetical protein
VKDRAAWLPVRSREVGRCSCSPALAARCTTLLIASRTTLLDRVAAGSHGSLGRKISGGTYFVFSSLTITAKFSSWCASAVQLREILVSTADPRAELVGSAPSVL